MQTFTVQVKDDDGLKALNALEAKQFIRIVENTGWYSPALPGQTMNINAFKNWIDEAEDTPTVHLKQAKAKWAKKRKQLLKLSK